jgi:aminopeptidase N
LTEVYHEVSHFWTVKSLDPEPSRLESEGLAMFLQYLAQEKLENKPGALDKGAERLRGRFREWCLKDPKAADVPINDYGKKDLGDLSYIKGMLFFYVLSRAAGEKEFLEAIGGFYQKHHETGATLEEFLRFMKQALKKDLSGLYRDWIYGTASSGLLLDSVPLKDIIAKYS